jgi:hypothetical protein
MQLKAGTLRSDYYGRLFIAARCAALIDAGEFSGEGPVRLQVEVSRYPYWDDLVEVYRSQGSTETVHGWQVKNQRTGLDKEDMLKLLRALADSSLDRGHLALHSLEEVKKVGQLHALAKLCERMRQPNVDLRTVLESMSAHQRKWVGFARKGLKLSDDEACLRLFQRLSVEQVGTEEHLSMGALKDLRRWYEDPRAVLTKILGFLEKNPDEAVIIEYPLLRVGSTALPIPRVSRGPRSFSMFSWSRLSVACLALLLSAPALAVELNYKWKKGDTHRFSYEDDTTLEMAMAGMAAMPAMPGMPGMEAMGSAGGGMKIKVQTVFKQKVLAVRPDGSADMELTVEKLDFFQGGQKVANITQVPLAARVVKAEVDRKGNAKFYKMVTLYMQEDRMILGVHNVQAGPNGVRSSASATVGDQKVEVVASVDPKSGKVTAAMKTSAAPPPALKAVQIKEEDPGIDVLPKQIFEMMVLPEGNMEPGTETRVAAPFGNLLVALDAVEGGTARIRTRLEGQRVGVDAQPAPGATQQKKSEEDEADTDMGGMNMGGMNMGGPPGGMGAPEGGMPSAGMKMDADITSGFDVAKGRLMTIAGTVSMDTDMGAGRTRVNSRLNLKRIP